MMQMNKEVKKLYDEILLEMKKRGFDKEEINSVARAMDYAIVHHQGQYRTSGEPYVTHPMQVCKILISWGLDTETFIAGILHDVVEDTDATLDEIRQLFGDTVAKLVDAVTKVSSFSSKNRDNMESTKSLASNGQDDSHAEAIVKVFLGMSKDLRVIMVKLADRLHNMRTIECRKREKQVKKALETKEVYALIAARLGMYEVKTELNNICMKILQPTEYKKTYEKIERIKKKYYETYQEALLKIESCLEGNHLECEVISRVKSVWSTYEKMAANENINDLFAVRIVVDKVLDCYLALGIVHSNFFNMDNSFKDFISTPKINLYQSLHTIIDYKGLNIEIQIRTKDMDRIANYGIASHWKYKEKHHAYDMNFDQISTIVSDSIENKNSQDSLSLIKKIAKQKFINVMDKNTTQWKKIPENTKLIDFAFATNKQKFDYIDYFLVNGQYEKMFYILQPGDIIEVVYSASKTINKQWEYISHDSIVKKHIHESIQKLTSNSEKASNEFVDEVAKYTDGKVDREMIREFVNKHFHIPTIKDFIDCMSIINIPRNELLKLFGSKTTDRRHLTQRIQSLSWKWLMHRSLFESDETNFMVDTINITDCCSKIPPLEVVGIINGNSLNVHRFNCPKINPKDKMVVLKWSKEKIKRSSRSFKAKVIMNGYFTPDCSTSIISVITRYKGVISKFDLNKNKTNKEFTINSDIYVKNYSNLEKMMSELSNKGMIHDWKLI